MIAQTFDALADLPLWVLWKTTQRGGKPTKVPFTVHGRKASSTDATTWTTLAKLERAAPRYDGVGIVMAPLDESHHLGGVDLDSCIDDEGNVEKWAREIVERLASYTEVSPSGHGLKIFFTYDPRTTAERHWRSSVKRPAAGGGKDPGIEFYLRDRYFTVTGKLFECFDRRRQVSLEELVDIQQRMDAFAPTRHAKEPAGQRPAGSAQRPTDDHALALQCLAHIPNDGAFVARDAWLEIGMALHDATGGSTAGQLAWASWTAQQHANAQEACADAWKSFKTGGGFTLGTLVEHARRRGFDPYERKKRNKRADDAPTNGDKERDMPADKSEAIGAFDPVQPGGEPPNDSGPSYDDFFAYLPDHSYIFRPTGVMFPPASVNAILPPVPVSDKEPLSPSKWLDQNRPVHQTTWAPGFPETIKDRGITEGGWFNKPGLACYNQYRPPTIKRGDAAKAGPWLNLVRFNYPNDADHLIAYFAQRVQHPETKINHALALIGSPGIGKDTMLEPLKLAVGPWNFKEVAPHNLLEQFNPFVKAVVLRISEARDLGDVDRFQFYERIKTIAASPPDVLMCNEKHLRQQQVLNVCGVIITSNHRTDCLYLPPDDRRHYVAHSERRQEDFQPNYWTELWQWYESGGFEHVAAYLGEYDLAAFDPKAPPTKTPAFWNIVDASRASEDAELADALDDLGKPIAVTVEALFARGEASLGEWLKDRKNRRIIPRRMEKCGYVPTRNDTAEDGLWRINRRRQVVYGRDDIPLRDRLAAAQKLAQG